MYFSLLYTIKYNSWSQIFKWSWILTSSGKPWIYSFICIKYKIVSKIKHKNYLDINIRKRLFCARLGDTQASSSFLFLAPVFLAPDGWSLFVDFWTSPELFPFSSACPDWQASDDAACGRMTKQHPVKEGSADQLSREPSSLRIPLVYQSVPYGLWSLSTNSYPNMGNCLK